MAPEPLSSTCWSGSAPAKVPDYWPPQMGELRCCRNRRDDLLKPQRSAVQRLRSNDPHAFRRPFLVDIDIELGPSISRLATDGPDAAVRGRVDAKAISGIRGRGRCAGTRVCFRLGRI